MKRSVFVAVFSVMALSAFAIPRGLTDKPVEQLASLLNKPVPEGFTRMSREAYYQTGDIVDGLLLQKGLAVENGLVRLVTFVWQSNDYEKMLRLAGELYDLLDQYDLTVMQEGDRSIYTVDGHTLILDSVQQEGRTYAFSLGLH